LTHVSIEKPQDSEVTMPVTEWQYQGLNKLFRRSAF